jgi:hypothetical protein
MPAATGAAAGPMPPEMHWVVVLLLTWITCGLGGLIWAFRQASFVKKIHPASKAVLMLVVSLLGMVAQVVVYIGALSAGSGSGAQAAVGLILLLNIVILAASLAAIFGMRSSLVNYYNTVEPMGLELSGAITFFFNILYFQYHLSRIARWKKTGQLS